MAHVPHSPDILKVLDVFEQKLDAMRRHVEQMPLRSGKKANFFSGNKFKRETKRLKAELENHLYALLANGSTVAPGASRSECVLELVTLGTCAAGAICEAPVLNFLKPVVGITALICETAKCVKSNRAAAVELADHASAVTTSIVNRASAMDGGTANRGDALGALKLALEDIQTYLTLLRKPRRRLAPWIFANQEKDRVVQLNKALDQALAMFSAANILSTAVDVRTTAGKIGILVSTVERLDTDVNRALTILHTKLSEVDSFPKGPNPRSTAVIPFLARSQLTLFFLGRLSSNVHSRTMMFHKGTAPEYLPTYK
ncbi:hypothetical protein B0H17DRAFT_553424 [Mycena rosella]|uniref:Uncharacterized protein n=1 Tax=Mycena rosella TaxID=1033263 RepID=A0AAD7GEV6_MYCRO|nr:hypothetical protein B0H17DRAFT_553424 [Mycena rosella]